MQMMVNQKELQALPEPAALTSCHPAAELGTVSLLSSAKDETDYIVMESKLTRTISNSKATSSDTKSY